MLSRSNPTCLVDIDEPLTQQTYDVTSHLSAWQLHLYGGFNETLGITIRPNN